MRKIRWFILSLFMMMTFAANAQDNVYTLVKPDCGTFSFGIGGLINNKAGDFDFNQNYITYDIQLGKFFNKYVGITGEFSYYNSTGDFSDTRMYTIGLMLNSRLTNYYAYSPIDLNFNLGLSYGRFDFKSYIDSEGMNYVVPKVSLDIVFNLSSDKAYQFVLEPSYQFFIPTEEKYYYDDGSKVDADISAIGIKGKFRVNF